MTSATDLARATSISPHYRPDILPRSAAARTVAPGHAALQYCLLLVLLPLLAIPIFIALGRSDFFLNHGGSIWVQSNDAVFNMHDRNCDVLIFGDSTAMTGINPEVVDRNTGFRTCNIAVTNAVLAVTDNLTLEQYLAHNGKPRVLLIQLSPDGFQPENHAWRRTIYAEGLLEQLRHGDPAESRQILLSHPQESVAFAGYAAGFSAFYAIKDVWYHTTRIRSDEDAITIHNGFFTPPAPPRTFCESTSAISDPTHSAFPRTLVNDYHNAFAGRAGLVLVNVAPIPACDQNLAAYSSQLEGITSNPLLSLPIGLFNDGRHYTALGATVVSRLVAQELNEAVSQNPAIDDRVPQTSATAFTLRRARLPLRR